MEEIWKDIKGYEGIYIISNLGRIKKTNYRNTGNEKEITFSLYKGYNKVTLYDKNKVKKSYAVHRLVCETFVPNPGNKTEVDHINAVRSDNSACNLRWVTHKENCNNPLTVNNYSNSRKGVKNPNYGIKFSQERIDKIKKNKSKPNFSEETIKKMCENRKGSKNARALKVLQFTKQNEFIKEWDYIKQASIELGICYTCIINCCKNKRKTAGGYIWRYKE